MIVSAQQSLFHRRSRPPNLRHRVVRAPSAILEYAYYFAVVYSVMAPALGLEIPLLAGLLILAIWSFCLVQVRSNAKDVFTPIMLLIACVTSLLIIQVSVHDEPILDPDLRSLITWIMGLMIVQSLLLRPGFSHRFPIVLFIIGAATLPFLGVNSGEVDMTRVDIAVQGGLTHPAGFADWFGFCAIFFAVFGIESRKPVFKIGAWGLMFLCVLLVTLSVERGPLFATALGLILAFRSTLKRGFLPLFVLTVFAGVISFTGVFEQAASNYLQRGFEDTGREVLWPEAIDRIEAAPLFGDGQSNAWIHLTANKVSPPHNSVLYFALISGIVPSILFAAFWLRIIWRTILRSSTYIDNSFCLPYLTFIIPSLMLVDTGFMTMGGLLSTALLASASRVRSPQFLAGTLAARSNLVQRQAYRHRPLNTARTRSRPLYGVNPDRRTFK